MNIEFELYNYTTDQLSVLSLEIFCWLQPAASLLLIGCKIFCLLMTLEKIWGKLKCLTRNILSLLEIFWNSFQFTDSSCVWTKPFRIVLHHFCVLCVAFCITRTRPKGNFLQIEIRKGLNHHLPSNSWLKSTSINLRAEGHRWDVIASKNVKYYELLRKSTQFLEQKESERNRLGEYWAQLHETLLLHVDSCGNNEGSG